MDKTPLNVSQRAYRAAKWVNRTRGGIRTPGQKVADEPGSISMETAARKANVSYSTMRFAANVRRYGIPELQTAVKLGKMAVSIADPIARMPHLEQRIALMRIGIIPKLILKSIDKPKPIVRVKALYSRIVDDGY